MNFCSHCGSDQIHLSIPEGDNRLRFVCPNCKTIHYQNPNIIAGCLPIWEGKVLLCKRAIEPRAGYWNVPAGFMENGEKVEEGAQREVWEEALGKVDIKGVLAIYNLARINQVYIHFYGDLIDGAFGIGEESTDAQLFSEEEVPWNEIAFASSSFALKRYFADRKAGTHQVHVGSYPDAE